MWEAKNIVNAILDYVIINTYFVMQLKPDMPNLRKQDDIFYLGIINKEIHQQVINKLKKRGFSLYLQKKRDGKKNYDDTSIG